MTRAFLILANDKLREKAADWCARLPLYTRVEFKEPKRTLDQNALMWVLLGHVAKQKEHFGRVYKAELWKSIFMHAMGQEIQFIPSLDGASFIPIGMKTSELSVREMTDLIEYIYCWGAENSVDFGDDSRGADKWQMGGSL